MSRLGRRLFTTLLLSSTAVAPMTGCCARAASENSSSGRSSVTRATPLNEQSQSDWLDKMNKKVLGDIISDLLLAGEEMRESDRHPLSTGRLKVDDALIRLRTWYLMNDEFFVEAENRE